MFNVLLFLLWEYYWTSVKTAYVPQCRAKEAGMKYFAMKTDLMIVYDIPCE